MYKYLITLLMSCLLVAETGMKCAPGKCGDSMQANTPKIPSKASTNMKCAAGKCAAATSTNNKKVPPKEQPQQAMKCAAGKCGMAMQTDTHSKDANDNKPTIEQLFNVRTVKIKSMKRIKKQVNYGYIKAQDSLIYDVTPWFSGFVQELYVDTLYQKVNKGDPLLKAYSPEVYKAKQDYINSINYNQKASMPEMLESAKIKLKLLGVNQKEIDEIAQQHTIDTDTTIYAPASGWIFQKNINKGSAFSAKKSIYQIINLDKVWVEAKLFQHQLPLLDKLTEFSVSVEGIEKKFKATKELLYPMLDPKEATLTLRLSIENTQNLLKPGMYAKIYASSTAKKRLLIPNTALIRKNGTWYAFLATEFKGEYEPVEIKVKVLDNQYYEVLSGLQEGDEVVENALFMMDSDAQINSIY